ncbi:hypothetical protein [Comamonas sp. C24C]
MAFYELLRNGKAHSDKEGRLLSLARRAGDLEIKAMQAGQRDRAYHFMRRMYRLLDLVAALREQESEHA